MNKTYQRVAALLLALTASFSANAGILIESGEEVIVNFDLTSLIPGPPFANVSFGATFDAADPVDVGVENIQTLVFGGLNGTNLIQVREDALAGFGYSADGLNYGPLTTANAIFNAMNDGLFSIGFRANSSAIVNTIYARGNFAGGGSTETVTVELREPVAVSEPGTIALFGLGLLGLAMSRRKLKSVRR